MLSQRRVDLFPAGPGPDLDDLRGGVIAGPIEQPQVDGHPVAVNFIGPKLLCVAPTADGESAVRGDQSVERC